MHATGGHLLPASPAAYVVSTPSCSSSSIWRLPRSTVSSPEFSDSKDEEDMDIDQDENSTRTDSVLQLTSTFLMNHTTISPFSLSDLYISEHSNKRAPSDEKAMLLKRPHSFQPVPSCDKTVLSKHLHSFQVLSAEKTFWSSSHLANSTNFSLSALTNESDDSGCRPTEVRQVSSPCTTRTEQLSLVPLNEVNSDNETYGTLRSATLQEGQHRPLFNAKSFLFSVTVLLIVVAVFVGYVQQLPATQCVDHIDVESLRHELEHRVHGQHIAVNIVVKSLKEFTSASDRRLLVLSFHGWTGIGKNFMSSIIAQHLPRTNVHKFIVPLHFARATDSDGSLLSEWIVSNMSSPFCGLHLFIIDEIDKASGNLVHSLHETLSKLSTLSDISCRAVFLLLTNDAATEINAAVTEILMNGGSREDLDYVDLVPHLSSEWYTELVSAKLIDQSVPFLPLERQHVAQCTETELKQRQVRITRQLVDDIVNSLSYFPANVSLFSSSGCRRITHLVDLFL